MTYIIFIQADGLYQLIFTLGSRSQEIKIDIIDDNLIEPYEFFTVEIMESGNFNLTRPQQVIYIEDNDCKFIHKFLLFIKNLNIFKILSYFKRLYWRDTRHKERF